MPWTGTLLAWSPRSGTTGSKIATPPGVRRGDGLPADNACLWPRLATSLARPGRSYTIDVARLLETPTDDLIETITGQAVYYRLYHQALADWLRDRHQHDHRLVTATRPSTSACSRPSGGSEWYPSWLTADPYLLDQFADTP